MMRSTNLLKRLFILTACIVYVTCDDINELDIGTATKEHKLNRESYEIKLDNSNNSVRLRPDQSVDFKITMKYGIGECYYQYLKPGDVIHFIFNVVKGGNQQIRCDVKNPNGELIYTNPISSFVWYDNSQIQIEGDYEICMYNYEYSEKTVFVNLITYTMDEIVEKHKESGELDQSTQVLFGNADKIKENLHEVKQHQIFIRILNAKDWYYVKANNSYVMYYSIAQCIVVIISGFVQVHFIRKLFVTVAPNTKNYKPRA